MIILFTTLIPYLAAVGLGLLLASRKPSGRTQITLRLVQGLLILFAIGYIITAMNASYYARTFWPTTPWAHSLGPDWPSDLFWDAARELKLTGIVFVIIFLLSVAERRSAAK